MMVHESFGVVLDTGIPSSLEHLLPQTIYGTEGKLQYRHQDPITKLGSISGKWVLSVWRKSKIIAVAVYIQRGTTDDPTFYVRYVSFNAFFKTNGGRQAILKRERNHKLQQAIVQQIHQKLLHSSENSRAKAVFYSYIEEDNLASLKLSQRFGYETVREMHTLVFNRFFPKRSTHAAVLDPSQKPKILEYLKNQYSGYNFFEVNTLFEGGTYYVFQEGDQILGGLKATICTWEIVNLPGIEGFWIQHVFPKLPVLSRIFYKDKIKFVAMEGVWYKPGFEKQLLVLMESVIATEGLYMGMLWFDMASQVGEYLSRSGRLGLLQKINKSGKAKVMCKFEGYEEAEKQLYRKYPAYISAIDIT